MIQSLKINNIQSHENTQLLFSKGVNVIIGASNQGKSAILRALYWVRNNRPLGIDTLASHWALNEKGNLTTPMSVVLTNDNGVVERRRSKDDNQYIVNGNELNVVKTDVPVQVEETLRLSDTNLQKQLDAPFLLSQTSGEVAKYFNSIVNLDVIDKVLTNVESKRRKTKSDIESTKERVDELEKSLNEYDWIDEVEPLIADYMEIDSRYNEAVDAIETIEDNLNRCEGMLEWIDWLKCYIERPISMVKRIESIYGNLESKEDDIAIISSSIKNYLFNKDCLFDEVVGLDGLVNELDDSRRLSIEFDYEIEGITHDLKLYESSIVYDMEVPKKYIRKLDVLMSDDSSSTIRSIEGELREYERAMKKIDECSNRIDNLKECLPLICPLCGHPIEEDGCV